MSVTIFRGCSNSPFNITTDPQWETFKTILANAPKSVTEVKINVIWNELKKWKPSQDDSVSPFMYPQLQPPDNHARTMNLMKELRYAQVNRFFSNHAYSAVGSEYGEIY